MFNIKLFPQFQCPDEAPRADQLFLEQLRRVRDRFEARFVNFSVYDYSKDNPDAIHFITYPMSWISLYLRNYFAAADPFNRVDFRRVAHVDWADIYAEGQQAEIFHRFTECGLGDHALSLSVPAGGNRFAVLSMVFQVSEEHWKQHKLDRMEGYRTEADGLARSWTRLHLDRQEDPPRLTQREKDILRLVALGQTDERIAQTIGIARWTVVGHLKSAKYKLGCTNRASAVALAITAGLIDLKSAG